MPDQPATPANVAAVGIGSSELVLRLVAEIEKHEAGVMEIVRTHNSENEQNQYARGHYVGMGKAYRNVLAMISNLSLQNAGHQPRSPERIPTL